MIEAIYKHTNIIAQDWEKLARFYQDVFGCEIVAKRDISGKWLADGAKVPNASLKGAHLRLPGHSNSGPTLEIFTYSENIEKPNPLSNRKGFGHICFEVKDVEAASREVLKFGGKPFGTIATHEIADAGTITFTYVLDPEDNIVELQSWRK